MDLASFDGRAMSARRERLAARLSGQPALIASGAPRARNYAANTFPFRATSHFLYLFGLPLRGGFGLWDGAAWTLYLPQPEPDAALWHGPEPDFAEIAAAVGCPVRSRSALPTALAGRAVATLPAPDLETCAAQSDLLRRPVRPGQLEAVDAP